MSDYGKTKYLIFRDNYGKVIITTIKFSSMSVDFSYDCHKMKTKYIIKCNSLGDSISCIHKFHEYNAFVESIATIPNAASNEYLVELVSNFMFMPNDNISAFLAPDVFMIVDYIEGTDKYSLELLFELNGGR